MVEAGFTNNVYGVVSFLYTHGASNVLPSTTQVNGGVRLKF